MERGNFAAAAGFGLEKGKQGIFSTFAAFMEMVVSELTMARLNYANILCHFSHSGMCVFVCVYVCMCVCVCECVYGDGCVGVDYG